MDDLISRRAAIDALGKYIKVNTAPMHYENQFWVDGMEDAERIIKELPSAHRPVGEWCVDCSEYDSVKHCCPRFGRVIRTALDDVQRWIPVTERLPEELEEVNITWINTDPELYYDSIRGKHFSGSAVYYKGRWYWYSAVCTDYLREYGFSPNDEMDDAIKVLAWMPLPEPARLERE